LSIYGTISDRNGRLVGNPSVSKKVYQYVKLSYKVPSDGQDDFIAKMIFKKRTYITNTGDPIPVPG